MLIMNRFLILIVLFTFSMTAFPQKKLFEKALKKGPQSNGYYLMKNTHNRKLDLNDLKKYAHEKGYILGNVYYKEIIRFGDYDDIISSLEFLPKSEYPSYIYSNISRDITLPNPSVSCSAYVYSLNNSSLKLTNNLNWSGTIIDGMANGHGVIVADYGQYILFVKGQFSNGFPIGELSVTRYNVGRYYEKFQSSNLSKDFMVHVGDFHDGLAHLKANDKYGFVDNDGNLVINNDIDEIISEFSNGRATVSKNNEEIIINRNGTLIDYTDNQKNTFASASYLEQAVGYISSDAEKAFYMLDKSNKFGNTKAVFWLGKLFAERKDGKKDYQEAVKWYKKALELNDTEALYELGRIYSNNNWNGHDEYIATSYYMKAAELGHQQAKAEVEKYFQNHNVYTFNMKDVDFGTDFNVSVNTRYKTLTASKNGREMFDCEYYIYKIDNRRGRIGFSLAINGVADIEANTNQYFVISRDGVVAIKLPNGEEYPLKANDKQSFSLIFDFLAKALSNDNMQNRSFVVNGVSFTMMYVKGGTLYLGATREQGDDADPDEYPGHKVTVDSYMIGQTEVTQALWKAVMGNNPSLFTGDSNRPVERVSWDDCQTFIRKLNSLTGQHFRLPTEAEWEFAARGGTKCNSYKYAGSNDLGNVGWYWQNSGNRFLPGTDDDWDWNEMIYNKCATHPVGKKNSNELGIYDMSGNVFEWCYDWWGEYSANSLTNPKGPSYGSHHVAKGGCWSFDAGFCRVSNRNLYPPDHIGNNLGFRLAL